MNPLQLRRWQFSHTETLQQTFFKQSTILYGKRPFCVFTPPPPWDLEATYDVHLRLIEKRVVDFLLVLTELFSLGITAKALRANIDLKSAFSFQHGQFDPKFQVEGIVTHQPFFFSENYNKWSFIRYKKIWAELSFCFVTIHAFDRQTDRQTDRFLVASQHWHYMQCGMMNIRDVNMFHNRVINFWNKLPDSIVLALVFLALSADCRVLW